MPCRPVVALLAACLTLTFGLAAAPVAHADSYSAVVVYGDSLSDNGNLYAAVGYPPAPYYNGRFSNGPVAVEQLASTLGASLVDFAYGGATTGVGNYIDGGTQTTPGLFNLPGMEVEFAASQPTLTPALTSTGLFVVFGGANDFFSAGDPAVAAANIVGLVTSLEALGATHILVPGVPDLGLTPEFYGNALATGYSLAFNSVLQASLPKGATYVDTFNLLHEITADPGAYGLTDVTDPCFNGLTVCANPSQYLFWDGVHPTTATDAILANEFVAAATPVAATPEPGSLFLTLTGLLGTATLLRRRIA